MADNLYNWTIKGPWITEPTTDTQWKHETVGGVLYIAFQGSVSRLDWLQNIMFWKKPYKRMKKVWFAHAGFVKKWKAVEDDVLIAAEGTDKIMVSGFSQGAAIAQLCFESIRFHFPDKKSSCLVYASPLVFGMVSSRNVMDRIEDIQLIERHHDLICKMPPRWMLYRKAGVPKMVDKWWPVSFRFKKTHMGYKNFLKE